MNIMTNETAIKLMFCVEAFEAMLAKGEMPTADQLRLAIDAMREAMVNIEERK